MVMTLRKRVPPIRRTPSPVREIISTNKKNKKTQKIPKSKPKSRKGNYTLSDSESEFESESDLGSGSGSDSEKENGTNPCGYENVREQRIRENKERMEKLGIFVLSSQTFNGKKRPIKNVVKRKRNPPILPRRSRSERLKNSAQGNYLESEGISIPDMWKPEVYTEEDEKLLGDCEEKWKLDVDGIGEDGDLLYDPVSGLSCHQCRNKTLRKHTHCNKCRSPQGQLCGDCLFTRYGENVLEAKQNPKWLCPACRGICNCSRCRREKGWLPVTLQYPKVVELGYKSIAHYLILNKHAGNTPKKSESEAVEVVDLTAGETPAPPRNEGSDGSDWSQSDSDDSDSDSSATGNENENNEQSVEMQVDIAEPETLNGAVGAADDDVVLREFITQHLAAAKRS